MNFIFDFDMLINSVFHFLEIISSKIKCKIATFVAS